MYLGIQIYRPKTVGAFSFTVDLELEQNVIVKNISEVSNRYNDKLSHKLLQSLTRTELMNDDRVHGA